MESACCSRAILNARVARAIAPRRALCHATTPAAQLPQSQDEAIEQARSALQASFEVGTKRKKKGRALWPGVKKVAVEIPIADDSPASDLELAQALLSALPAAAGLPVVVFGNPASAELARQRDLPFASYSVPDLTQGADDEDDEGLEGPLLLFATKYDQAAVCARAVQELWTGRALIVANAEWMRDAPPAEASELADALDAVYYFLPVSFSGLLGGGKTAFLFRQGGSEWVFYLAEGNKEPEPVGRMKTKPSNEDMETMVYNASAAKSPLAAGARALKGFGNLAKGFKR